MTKNARFLPIAIAMTSALALALALALAPDPRQNLRAEAPLSNAEKEKTARNIIAKLQCLVCQGQPLAQSEAPLAIDLRRAIRKKIARGESEKQILAFLVRRYGEAILLKPPITGATIPLWSAPIFLLIFGSAVFFRFVRRAKKLKN